jgi:SAM-dependent methyltransferase
MTPVARSRDGERPATPRLPYDSPMQIGRTGRTARRIATGIYRRINRNSTVGLPWRQEGDFVTFEWDGFVDAPSIPALFARHHYETARIRELLADKNVQRSLEFGCGYGRLSPTIASLSTQHTAIDINAEAVAAARVAHPDLDFRLSSGSKMAFPDNTFDLVVTWTVLQHVRPERIGGVLSELRRVLAAEGNLLLCEETRDPGAEMRHCWHREPSFYADRFTPLRLTHSSYIEEIDRIPGMTSPGRVMLFESRS